MPNKRYQKSLYSSQKNLEISTDGIRNLSTPAEKGALIRKTFKENITEILPEKIGVSNGVVIDSEGSESKQMDIILYDKMNSPRLFTNDSVQVFPVESTYACGEIKNKLGATELQDSFKNCYTYKNLNRKAYFDTPNNVNQQRYKLYGTDSIHWKSIFFILTTESVSSSELIEEYKRIVNTDSLPMEKRVDSIYSLQSKDNGNVVCHYSDSYDFLPSEKSHLHGIFVDNSWGFFMNLLLKYMVQARTEPIDILQYG